MTDARNTTAAEPMLGGVAATMTKAGKSGGGEPGLCIAKTVAELRGFAPRAVSRASAEA